MKMKNISHERSIYTRSSSSESELLVNLAACKDVLVNYSLFRIFDPNQSDLVKKHAKSVYLGRKT